MITLTFDMGGKHVEYCKASRDIHFVLCEARKQDKYKDGTLIGIYLR